MDPWIGESLKRLVGKREMPTSTFNAFFFETLNKRDYVALFGLRNLELRQGRGGMPEEHVPVALADTHASVGKHHVPAAIVHRSARARAEEIDEELLLAHDSVFSAMRPEPPELRIGPEPGQKIIRDRRDCAISTKALVKGLRPIAHCVLPKSVARQRKHGECAAEKRDELAALHVWMAPAWQEKM
jgi:hypothetical protein